MGDYFEQLTAEVTGVRRVQTDGTKVICPDLHWYGNTFIENKAVGKTRHVIVYQSRQEKDLAFVQQGHELIYFIWHHKAHCYGHRFIADLQTDLLNTLRQVYVIPHTVLTELLVGPVRVLNTSYTKDGKHKLGYGTKSTGLGWSLGLKVLEQRMTEQLCWTFKGRNVEVLWTW